MADREVPDAAHRLQAATPDRVTEPSDAERSRTLAALATHATLATVAADRVEGYPFGSLVVCTARSERHSTTRPASSAAHATREPNG